MNKFSTNTIIDSGSKCLKFHVLTINKQKCLRPVLPDKNVCMTRCKLKSKKDAFLILGKTGAGKSTIANMIMGYDLMSQETPRFEISECAWNS